MTHSERVRTKVAVNNSDPVCHIKGARRVAIVAPCEMADGFPSIDAVSLPHIEPDRKIEKEPLKTSGTFSRSGASY